jgi:ABC-type sugar transport system ATPase subunit
MSEMTKLKMVSLMIGRDATSVLHNKKTAYVSKDDSQTLLAARGLQRGRKTRQIDIDIASGQVLGVSGLLGSGRTELAKILFGDNVPDAGRIDYDGRQVHIKTPRDAIRLGMGFCSEDRKAEGIFPNMTVMENMTIGVLDDVSRFGVMSAGAQLKIAEKYIEKLKIKVSSPGQKMRELSGGNQQKVLLARWLCKKPVLMILDEPTRGIDLGAKSEIEEIIAELAGSGVAVLMISSELEELVRSCDRIAVLSDGKKVSELSGRGISEERLVDIIAHGADALEGPRDA